MSIEEIIKSIEIYLSVNQTKEREDIPYKNIFGNYYDSQRLHHIKRLHHIIGKELPSITIDGDVYNLYTWDGNDSLSYIKTRKNVSSTK